MALRDEVLHDFTATTKVRTDGPLLVDALDSLGAKAWTLFRELERRGVFRRKILFFTLDVSDEVAALIREVFGPEPGR